MTFYLRPPRGEINLHMLVECVQQRIKCYKHLQQDLDIKNIEEFEYLLEDSILDRTGHFIFRLGVLAGTLSRYVFLENEVKLLNKRMECYNKEDMELFLRKIVKQLRNCIRFNIEKELSDFYWILYKVVIKVLEKDYLLHVYEMHSSKSDIETLCYKDLSIPIPFWYCEKVFPQRTLRLQDGDVIFPCRKWKDILMVLYSSYLKIVLNQMKYSNNVTNAFIDDRIRGCLKLLKNCNPRNSDNDFGDSNNMGLKDLNEEVKFFPLCMKSLFISLQKNHRLAHNARFELSVFLKEIGLSMNDSVKFWQEEYSKQHSSCSKCSHNWQDNERKYIYGIRHLYGKEGSRKNYSTRSCSYLQDNSIGINSEGGCPFVHYDDDNLRSALKKDLPGFDDDIEVMIFERTNNPSYSCQIYGECSWKHLKKDVTEEEEKFQSPLQYYNQIKKKI